MVAPHKNKTLGHPATNGDLVSFNVGSGQTKWSYEPPETEYPQPQSISIVSSSAGNGVLAKTTDFYNDVDMLARLDANGNATFENWGIRRLDYYVGQLFIGNDNNGAVDLIPDTPNPLPASGWTKPTQSGTNQEVNIHLPVRVYQIQNTTVSPNQSIASQIQQTQQFWQTQIEGLHLDWDNHINNRASCTAAGGCGKFPDADLSNYRPRYGCVDSVAWEALTLMFPNSPANSQGINFIYLNNIQFDSPPLFSPQTAIEIVPEYNHTAVCPTGDDIVMSTSAYGYVGAHSVGHVFGLGDITDAAAAQAPKGGINLMCSGLPVCGDSSKIGTYLTPVQLRQAQKGLLQWKQKPN